MAKPRIVVVEDESIVAGHLCEILTQLGYEAGPTALTGEQAIELVEENRPDLVLMDIMLLGDMDGIQAADIIRTRFGTPVIYLTSYGEESVLQRAKLTEPLTYILKPFRKETLRTVIEVALYKSQMAARLKASEAKYRELAELLPEIVYEIDVLGKVTFLNRGGMSAFGVTQDAIDAGILLSEFVDPPDRPRLVDHIEKTLKGGRLGEVEIKGLGKGGDLFPLLSYSHPILSEGRVVGIRGVAVDISGRKIAEEMLRRAHDELERKVAERTAELASSNEQLLSEIAERRQAQQAARESEQLFRAIFDSARDAVFVKNRSLQYTLVNPQMEALLDLPASTILGRTDDEIFGKEAGDHLRAVDSRVLEGEHVEEEHSRPVHGSYLTFHDVRVPLDTGTGGITGICGISRNITERKKATRNPAPVISNNRSKPMLETLDQARRVAQTDSIVLLLGESGSGKDFLARWIHERSDRSHGPFLTMNCAALPHELAEAELFGHESGAFTGARGRVRGFLELAEGGTLLLNEIGELPLSLQAKLLTFLDTRTFYRVGGREKIKVSARLMAATNRDLQSETSEGRFRSDLFFRLNVFSIRLPPLRERLEDLPLLAENFVAELSAQLRLPATPRLELADLERLSNYGWPGNIRELRNVLERALIVCREGPLKLDFMSPDNPVPEAKAWTVAFPPIEPLTDVVKTLRRKFIEEALHRTGGNKEQAARLLHISRFTLRRQMSTLGMLESKPHE